MAKKNKREDSVLVATEPVGKEGHRMATYRFVKCYHNEEKLYAPNVTPPKTRKVTCYECQRFRVLAGW